MIFETVDLHASVIKLEAKLNAKEKEINVHKARSQEAVGARRGLESELVTTKEELEAVRLDMKEIRNGHPGEEDEDNYSNERRRSSTGKYSKRRCEQRSCNYRYYHSSTPLLLSFFKPQLSNKPKQYIQKRR